VGTGDGSRFRTTHKKASAVPFFLLLALLTGGCDKSPQEPFARLVEQAASWASAARFADQLHGSGEVPQAYLEDLLKAGSQDLQKLRPQIAKSTAIPQEQRSTALELTSDLEALISAAALNEDRVADVESRLRELARNIRGS